VFESIDLLAVFRDKKDFLWIEPLPPTTPAPQLYQTFSALYLTKRNSD